MRAKTLMSVVMLYLFGLTVNQVLMAQSESVYDPSLKRPSGLEAPDESKTLGRYVIPGESSKGVPELFFKDHTGKTVRLSDYFDGKRPVVLNMIYIGCPRLCTEVLNGMTESIQRLNVTPGKDYRVLTISFDPREGGKNFSSATSKRASYMEEFMAKDKHGPRALNNESWSVLVEQNNGEPGINCDSKKLAELLDFNYKYNDKDGIYEHPSVTMVLSPKGKISRYLYGVKIPAKDMKLALVKAGEGKVGSSIEKLISWCYRYDPKSNGYTPAVLRLLSITAGVSALLFGGFMFVMWRREARRGSIK